MPTDTEINPQKIRVLILEDRPTDAQNLLCKLRRAGFAPEWQRVEAEPEFLAALDFAPDLILADYNLPHFDGLKALARLREHGLDIPFILISETIGEEIAVNAIQQGADDYLIKDRLMRLGVAVKHALQRKQQRDERQWTVAQLRLQSTALETAANAIIITDRTGAIVWVNPAFTSLTGYTAEDVLGKTPRVLKSGKHDLAFYKELWKTILAGKPWHGEFTNRRKDGSLFYDEHTITPVQAVGGQITHFIGVMNDVTGRKQVEEQIRSLNQTLEQRVIERTAQLEATREKLAVTLHSIGDAVLATDDAGRITWLNPIAEKMTGWTEAEAIGLPIAEVFQIINEETRRPAIIPVDAVLATGQIHGLATHTILVARDGTERSIADSAAPIRSKDGRILGVVLVFRNVSEERRVELQVASLMKELEDIKVALDEHAIVAITDAEGKITYVNDKFCTISQHTREELIGQDHRIVNANHHSQEFMRALWTTITEGKVWHGEIKNRAKGGSFYWVDTTIVPFLKPDGKPFQFVAINTDITERKRAEDEIREFNTGLERLVEERTAEMCRALASLAEEHTKLVAQEEALRVSEKKFRRLFEQTADALLLLDSKSGTFLDCNQAAMDMLRCQDKQELLSLHPANVSPPCQPDGRPSQEKANEMIAIALKQGSHRFEWVHRSSNRTNFPVEVLLTPIQMGEHQLIMTTWRDITERKKTEAELLRLYRQNENILAAAGEGICGVDLEGRTTFANPAAARMLGYEPGEIVGLPQHELIHHTRPDGSPYPVETCPLSVLMQDGLVHHRNDEVFWRRDGSSFPVEYVATPIHDESGEVAGSVVVFRDITERQRAEEELQFRNVILSTQQEVSLDGILVVDEAGKIVSVNTRFIAMWGIPADLEKSRLDKPVLDSVLAKVNKPEEFLKRVNYLYEHPSEKSRDEISLKDGRLFDRYSSPMTLPDGQYLGRVWFFRDITERRQQERLVLRSQRLEAIGTLAGGVAHDLNNALAPIVMGVELLRAQHPGESGIIDLIHTSAKRGADMVRQLLSFAKGAENKQGSIQIHPLVNEMEKLLRRSFPKNIRLEVKCEPEIPTVLGDTTQLHQVLLNLCVNARDAMPDGGTLTLETRRIELDARQASSIPDAKSGDYVLLCVRDTGTGMPPEVLDRIFDPFFTTKGPEKGTGLGLSTVMGIVKGHGGFIQMTSQPEQGSTFAVYLPVAHSSLDATLAVKAEVAFHGRGETILFVDDEAAVREVAREVLRRMNFNPLIAGDGTDGLIQAAQHRTELHAIITDLHMPKMDGLTFVRTIRQMLPDIPIVAASGRMESAEDADFKTLGVTSRLNKPFTEAQLAEVLKNLLAPK